MACPHCTRVTGTSALSGMASKLLDAPAPAWLSLVPPWHLANGVFLREKKCGVLSIFRENNDSTDLNGLAE
jgi:hypothetical protein